MTHYETLEVSRQASPEVVRAAYRSLMQRFHPDRHPGDAAAAARAAAITLAYEVLSDADRRGAYDQSLATAAAADAMPAAMRTARSASPARGHAQAARGGMGPWWLWALLVVGVVWGAVWFAKGRMDPRGEIVAIRQAFADPATPEAKRRSLQARRQVILQQNPLLQAESAQDAAIDLAGRTVELSEEPLVVQLKDNYVLTIPRLRIVLGSFDVANLKAHVARHRERLLQETLAQLARADPVPLAAGQGAAELKALVRTAVNGGLNIDAGEEFPSTYFESPGRHGVVDVLLPERYALKLN